MLQRGISFVLSVAALFRSAVFRSFFQGSPEVRAVAWTGVIVLGGLAVINAGTAFVLQNLIRHVFDLCQKGATLHEALWVAAPAFMIYLILSRIEPKSEQKRTFYAIEWAKAATGWFHDTWIMSYRTSMGDMPKGLSQIIIDRPLLIARLLINLYVPVLRALIIFVIFGYLAWNASAELSPAISRYVPGWLFFFVVGYSMFEWHRASHKGDPLPAIFDESSRLQTDCRTEVDTVKELLRNDMPLCERIRRRDEARTMLHAWYSKYMTAYGPNENVLDWRSYNQQFWQFNLVIGLPLLAATGNTSLGAVAAAVYAINELRGSVLTISNQWLVVVEIEGLARGLRELEQLITKPKSEPVRAGALQPAE